VKIDIQIAGSLASLVRERLMSLSQGDEPHKNGTLRDNLFYKNQYK